MTAALLWDLVWALVGLDVVIFGIGLGSAMWINHRDGKRNAAMWAAYLAEHPELRARLGQESGRKAA